MGATVAETVHELLTADVTLMAILTGGLYLVDEPDPAVVLAAEAGGGAAFQNPINPKSTPNAFGANTGGSVSRLKPCGAVMTSTEPTTQQGQGRSSFVHVYFYERLGYANTRAARVRARAILHNRKVSAGGKGVELMHQNDLTNSADDSIAGGSGERPVSMECSHYEGMGRW